MVSVGDGLGRPRGRLRQSPGGCSWGVNRLDIFGLGTNNEMYHKAWNGSDGFPR
jgi:hypothetical protein